MLEDGDLTLLRCTVAGLIPLMMSEKYSDFTEEFYLSQKAEFNKILERNSYYLIRDLPVEIASRMLTPEIPEILSRQKRNVLWHNSTAATYDILSAFRHIQVLDDLIAGNKMKNVAEQITDKYDYSSLLIKSNIYRLTDEKDISEIDKQIQDIKDAQSDNGSWEETAVATVHHIEKLTCLGVSRDDRSVQAGIAFLLKYLNVCGKGFQDSGKDHELVSHNGFSRENRGLEFEATKKYKKEMDPKPVCYRRLGIMQNSLCLKLLVQMGLEHDERVESELDSTYSLYTSYNSLCYFKIQKRSMAKQKKSMREFASEVNATLKVGSLPPK